ncbi:hypothetical protein OG345_40110 [Streptomyces sp. NBC_01220]|uniref:hypothetical protein n=1 Tax=Streptomyces sp. NBC_01220 TaxID=2903781 RepID=UPI00352EBCA0|nr:hypothetical protein OG345_40110 [Streptomyces sp. NBC_01220]
MSDHEQQQPAPRRGKVLEALARAEQKVFTRPAPKSANAQVKFLLTRVKGRPRPWRSAWASHAAQWSATGPGN